MRAGRCVGRAFARPVRSSVQRPAPSVPVSRRSVMPAFRAPGCALQAWAAAEARHRRRARARPPRRDLREQAEAVVLHRRWQRQHDATAAVLVEQHSEQCERRGIDVQQHAEARVEAWDVAGETEHQHAETVPGAAVDDHREHAVAGDRRAADVDAVRARAPRRARAELLHAVRSLHAQLHAHGAQRVVEHRGREHRLAVAEAVAVGAPFVVLAVPQHEALRVDRHAVLGDAYRVDVGLEVVVPAVGLQRLVGDDVLTAVPGDAGARLAQRGGGRQLQQRARQRTVRQHTLCVDVGVALVAAALRDQQGAGARTGDVDGVPVDHRQQAHRAADGDGAVRVDEMHRDGGRGREHAIVRFGGDEPAAAEFDDARAGRVAGAEQPRRAVEHEAVAAAHAHAVRVDELRERRIAQRRDQEVATGGGDVGAEPGLHGDRRRVDPAAVGGEPAGAHLADLRVGPDDQEVVAVPRRATALQLRVVGGGDDDRLRVERAAEAVDAPRQHARAGRGLGERRHQHEALGCGDARRAQRFGAERQPPFGTRLAGGVQRACEHVVGGDPARVVPQLQRAVAGQCGQLHAVERPGVVVGQQHAARIEHGAGRGHARDAQVPGRLRPRHQPLCAGPRRAHVGRVRAAGRRHDDRCGVERRQVAGEALRDDFVAERRRLAHPAGEEVGAVAAHRVEPERQHDRPCAERGQCAAEAAPAVLAIVPVEQVVAAREAGTELEHQRERARLHDDAAAVEGGAGRGDAACAHVAAAGREAGPQHGPALAVAGDREVEPGRVGAEHQWCGIENDALRRHPLRAHLRGEVAAARVVLTLVDAQPVLTVPRHLRRRLVGRGLRDGERHRVDRRAGCVDAQREDVVVAGAVVGEHDQRRAVAECSGRRQLAAGGRAERRHIGQRDGGHQVRRLGVQVRPDQGRHEQGGHEQRGAQQRHDPRRREQRRCEPRRCEQSGESCAAQRWGGCVHGHGVGLGGGDPRGNSHTPAVPVRGPGRSAAKPWALRPRAVHSPDTGTGASGNCRSRSSTSASWPARSACAGDDVTRTCSTRPSNASRRM